MLQLFVNYFCRRFRQREWKVAVETYTEAIAGAQYIKERVNLLPVLFRNRSSALFAMKHFEQSLNDAKTSLQLEPSNAKVSPAVCFITQLLLFKREDKLPIAVFLMISIISLCIAEQLSCWTRIVFNVKIRRSILLLYSSANSCHRQRFRIQGTSGHRQVEGQSREGLCLTL